uniref:Uncharacterized protein n=1 Tax=Rhizophora mucronata TaxID=61149 RepID=A0A2P2J135_RHIMU
MLRPADTVLCVPVGQKVQPQRCENYCKSLTPKDSNCQTDEDHVEACSVQILCLRFTFHVLDLSVLGLHFKFLIWL